jgi:FkbM family methyltransferase
VHNGLFSLRCLELGAKKSYLYEPNINNYNKMNKLIDESLDVECFNLGVLDGSITECKISDATVCSTIYNDNGVLTAQFISFVDAVKNIKEQDCEKILKLDCEGSEFEIVLNSNPETIKIFSYLYLEIHDELNPKYKKQEKYLLKYLNDLGFEVVHTAPPFGFYTYDGKFHPAPVATYKLRNRNIQKLSAKSKAKDNFIKIQDIFNKELQSVQICAINKVDNKSLYRNILNNRIDPEIQENSITELYCRDILNDQHVNLDIVNDYNLYSNIFKQFNKCLINAGKIIVSALHDGSKDNYIRLLANNNFVDIEMNYYNHIGEGFLTAKK